MYENDIRVGENPDSATALMDRHPDTIVKVRPQGRVLLIEDEERLNQALAIRLRHAGFKVHQAYDGLNGLGDIASKRPDAVVLDLGLPSLNGYELLHRLQMLPVMRKVPVILMTGSPDPALEEKAERWGIKAVLRKPFTHKTLIRALRRALR